jgi:outer membrane protein OmpA-like peptidoglycan-associated protein
MIKSTLYLLFSILLGGISPVQAAEKSRPNAFQQIEQLQHIESLQHRADKLVFGETGADNYLLAKARTWLDMALSEYHENEGNGIIPAAIEQVETLLDALEKKQTGISMDTPVQVTGSEAVRPDLWNKIATLKKHEKFYCGQRPIAEAEVHLVWAGHEKLESSWAHAQSYARSAEILLKEAQASIDKCAAASASAMTQTAPPVIEKLTLSSDALFEFGEAALEPSALWRLNRLADNIRKVNTLEEVVLVGHTDRLRSDGHPERNQLLSEQRAESIKQYLAGKGIAADKIHTSGAGSSQPLVECSTRQSKAKQIDCLQPNRRVEIILRGAK